MSASAPTPGTLRLICSTCAHDCDSGAKFCSDCGSLIDLRMAHYGPPQESGRPAPTVPNFAPVAQRQTRTANNELRAEAAKLMLLLARERLFLYTHWLIFLGINLFGFSMALKCYKEYFGDDLTKLMIGFTPLLYINSCALLCIVPINGTRKEIARLKEKLHYVKFQIEYNHLL